MAKTIIAPAWKPTKKAPEGYYQSPMYPGMFLKKRENGALPADISVRLSSQVEIAQEVTDEDYASEGKRLASEDASRYGTAASSGKLTEYFEWRSEVGLTWWEQIEADRKAPANDNRGAAAKVAA